MKIVNLHGKLAEKFGARWELEINSISEALRAINANTGDFFDYLSEKQEENKISSKETVKDVIDELAELKKQNALQKEQLKAQLEEEQKKEEASKPKIVNPYEGLI